MLDREILSLIEQYVAEEIAVADFSQRFAGLYFAVRQERSAPRLASQLCNFVVGPLAEFSRGHQSEERLREGLQNILRRLQRQMERALQWSTGSISTPQQITVHWEDSNYEVPHQATSMSVSVPEMLEFSHV
jgi:hypothetical protein